MACLAKVPRVVLVKHDSVVVLATSIATASWVLPVLADTAVPCTDVPPLLAVLGQPCRATQLSEQDQ